MLLADAGHYPGPLSPPFVPSSRAALHAAGSAGGEGASIASIKSLLADVRDVRDSVVRRAWMRYGAMMLGALTTNDKSLALDAYDMAASLPSLTTVERFRISGYQVSGPLMEGSPLTICYKGARPHVL